MISSYGKVPQWMLGEIVYKYLGAKRNDVLLRPSIGEDASIVKGGDVMIASSCDPISGASKRSGWLAVNVSANDVATCGVNPLWFNSCLLLPKDFSEEGLEEICSQMDEAAKKLGIAIIGGHSEVTPGIEHPIIVGFCLGVVEGERYFSTGGVKPKSKIILTKGAGIEGTGILALDREEILIKHLGLELVEKAQNYIEKISVVGESLIAAAHEGVQSMHDPTEGGVIGGLNEMADASRCGFIVYEKNIAVSPETKAICNVFNIDPMRLISSGALLIAVEENNVNDLVNAIRRKRISCQIIGEFVEEVSHRIMIRRDGRRVILPSITGDELWKALEKPL